MKMLSKAIVILVLASVAQAEETTETICESVAHVAEIVMQERQNGVSMAEMMRRADGREPHVTMVAHAYKYPAMSTQKYKQKSIREFGDRWYSDCYRVRSGN